MKNNTQRAFIERMLACQALMEQGRVPGTPRPLPPTTRQGAIHSAIDAHMNAAFQDLRAQMSRRSA